VVAISAIRDVYGGRRMAEVMSMVMMVFMIIPVVAPSLGQVAMLFDDWPSIFLLMGFMSLIITVWTLLRLPETLAPEMKRSLSLGSIMEGFRLVLTNRVALCYTLASTAIFGALFGFINSAQQIYVGLYDVGTMFPVYFAIVAGLMAVSSFVNSRIVGRIGMRRLAHGALIGFIITTAIPFALSLFMPIPLWLFVMLFALAMFQFSWIGSNFNALAMEPLGHVAGTASSVQGFLQTVGGGVIGALIGQAFDGTITPMAAGYFFSGIIALILVLVAEKGRLFRTVNRPV
jgi:DHA1 family bicyclomycin/chloramphenicol resistance-like MFS transporter